MADTMRRFSTGLTFLDRMIEGGLPPGGLLSLTAPPTSQSELILEELMRVRQSMVVSTTRPEAEVQEWADDDVEQGEVEVVTADPESLLEDPEQATNTLVPESFSLLIRSMVSKWSHVNGI